MISFKNMNVLITGGAGFIGSNLTEQFTEKGAKVFVYDNLIGGKYEFLDGMVKAGKIKFVKGDTLNKELLESTLHDNEINAIVHLAANPNIAEGTKNLRLDLEQGTIATHNVLDAARKNDIKEILFSSSSAIYGMATIKPTKENYGPLKPISLYAASKLASEALVTSFAHLFGMNYYIYRFANPIGKNLTHGILIDLINRLKKNKQELEVLGDGMQRKSYIDVVDCVKAILFVYENSKSGENIYNISLDDQTEIKDIAQMVIDRFAKGAKIRYAGGKQAWLGDVPDTFLDNTQLKELGFVPKYKTSDEVVRNTIEMLWRQENKK